MRSKVSNYIKEDPEEARYRAPKTHYCKTKSEFDKAVGSDFIKHANEITQKGEEFLVGLSHGQSPSGAYEYILDHYSELTHPERLHFTCINSKLKRQRGLEGVRDALSFLRELIRSNKVSKDQILGRSLDRDNIKAYKDGLNISLAAYLKKLNKEGLDYIFVASDPKGQVAAITRNSKAFNSNEMIVLVDDTMDEELTITPWFMKKSGRIAFLATKAEKRRTLAWLFYRWGKPNESPSFLRFIDDIENRMTVFIDDHALTWPQVVLTRKTPFGDTSIRIDVSLPYDPKAKKKLPVILMIHGFLGLNTFDALLAFIPSHKYVAAAMHYGSIPFDLPPKEYSHFVMRNIDHVINYFGRKGHSVYIFDHSMANTYLMMMDQEIDKLKGIKKYVKGRISANPFFGQEAKFAATSFLDEVILKSKISMVDRVAFKAARSVIPFESKKGFRKVGILLSEWLIKTDNIINDRIWKAIKQRIMVLVSEMDMLPALNKVPMAHTLNRLPIKIFAIQVQSALRESKKFDDTTRLEGFEKYNIPTMILKSERDPIARFVSTAYDSSPNVDIIDITNIHEQDLFKEHLYYMIQPHTTINILERFIKENEAKRK